MKTSDLKTRDRFSSTLDKQINEKFQQLTETTRINKSKLLDEAISDLVKKYENPTKK
ncbi:ribbon-helix-helix domain-containing protein [Bacillus sp. TL12]|uniref:ribbon-helix-helix domain-containing protein n=1 Tax=Bacillus sp. TL12 TaxID=2894756 RepID=UPI001F52232D|nr:ribbon-helix-helix domain-containing protein [Bacillus sp. TL12]MCI0767300.1 ribbon-helix-helix domain-containing protein [Bacillus sp. TL12]